MPPITKKLDLPILRVPEWPARDRTAWTTAISSVGWFDHGGHLARYSQHRIRVFESAYGRWMGFLAIERPDLAIESGLDHLGHDLVRAFYERLDAVLAPCSIRTYLTDLLTVIRAMAPEEALEALLNVARYVWRTAEPVTNKYERLVPARDLFTLGHDLMQQAPTRSTKLKRASYFRDGLAIAMLIAVPVRLGNFASIKTGRHLLKQGNDFWLVFAGAEVKNGRPLEYRLPSALRVPINKYWNQYRPHLLSRRGRFWGGDAGNAFWISEHGTALIPSHIRERINRRTCERFGFHVNPHRFRDCAATSIAIEAPEHVGIIVPVLGHASAATGERYYNQAGSFIAGERYQAVIESFLQ